ncbi:DNA-directed RNA polymerase subunit delta [Mycoplasma sp. BRA290]|uniref:DNA-directed RNA polymerase subunit delta n=1 Tax=Mycoplasma sp. BRA290 TaxID=3401675 RepID=UPI003AAE3870
MSKRTMLEIAINKVNSNPTAEFTFFEIFDAVENELKLDWEERFVTEEKPYEKVRETKMGELHRLLTVDKRFQRTANDKWQGKNTGF